MLPINERIKQVRRTLNLTQSAFGKRIAISTSYLASMEIGDKKVNDRTIRLITMEFGVDEHWLRTGEGSMYNEEADVFLAKATSLFRLLNLKYQEFALVQLNALVELSNSNELLHMSGDQQKTR